jgi:DNA repair protein RadC
MARPRSSSSTITQGDPTPSQADVKLTRELAEAGRHMKVTVHDHIIIGSQGRSSLRALGLM